MKRAKVLVAFLLLITMIVIGLFACTDKNKELGALTFSADEDGIAFFYEGDFSFYYSVDGGEVTTLLEGFHFDFSTEIGEHVVNAYAEDSSGKKVAEGTFSYTTANISLSELTVSGNTVSWTAAAAAVYVREAGDYVLTQESSYTATSDQVTVRVKAEGGFDAENAIYYVGNPVTKSVRLSAEKLSSPKLKINDKTVTWAKVTNAVRYAVSYDGGRYATATSATLSDAVGSHTISVKAVGDGETYADSDPATYSYETKRAALQVSKTASDRVVLSGGFDGYSVSADGRTFSVMDGSTYVATTSSSFYFVANGGYDSRNKINYVESEKVKMDFVLAAEREAVVEDANAGVSAFWSVKELSNATWKSTDATISVGQKFDGSAALVFNAKNDNVSYKFSAAYSLADGYDHLSFYYRGDGISSLNVSLTKDGESFSVGRDLGVMPAYWVKVTLRFDEDGWTVGNRALRTLWENKNSEIESERPEGVPQRISDAYSLAELVSYFDRLNFIVCGNVPGGKETSLLLDDVTFGFDDSVIGGVGQPLYALGDSYVAIEDLGGGVENELLLFLDGDDAFRLYSTKLNENFTVNGTYRLYEGDATLVLEDYDAEFSLTLSFLENGSSAVVTSAAGEHFAHFTQGTVFEKAAGLNCNFEGENAANGWSAYTYQTEAGEWAPLSASPLDGFVKDGESVLRLSTGKDLTNKVVFNETGEKLGLANYFSIAFGNCDEGADEILVKFIAVDIYGAVYYLKGTENAYWTCEAGSGFVTFEHTLPKGIFLRSLVVVAEYRGVDSVSHLYFDDLRAEYHADPSLFSDYAAPEIQKSEYALTFTHTERARIEYSVNWSETWTEGETYSIPTDAGSYTIRVRAVIEANGAVSQIATYNFTVEKVTVSPITVTIGENDQTASWTTNGICSVRVDEKGADGYVEGEYRLYDQRSYTTNKNVVLNVRATGYFDEETDKYYVGSTEISKKIIVDAVLSEPTVIPTEDGITWTEVADANAYAVSVNGGDEVIREDRLLAFAIYEGTYTVRVKAVYLQDGEVAKYGNFSDAYTYSVRNVSLSQPVVKDDTATWVADAYKVYLSDNNGEYVENEEGSFTPDTIGGHRFFVKAVAGFDLTQNVYYYTENDVIKGGEITVENLLTPTLLLNAAKNGLYWAYLNDEDEIVHYVADMRSVYPFLSYAVSVNGGEWTQTTGDVYLFPSVAGEYTVRVMAKGNGKNVRDSEASEAYSFEVKVISLTDIAVVKGESESTASYDFVAFKAERKINSNGDFFPTTEKSFTVTVTTTITIRVSGGWDATNRVYYAGDPIEKTKKIVKPEKLAKPEIRYDSTGVSWNNVPHATGYRIVVNGETESVIKSLSYAYSTAFGDYDVEIVAVNENDTEQYPDSDAATITYHVSAVSLTNLSYVGAMLSWDYNGLLYMYIGDATPTAGDWTAYSGNEYVNESGNQATIWLEARAGYRSEDGEVFIYRGGSERLTQLVKNFSLTAPVLTKSGNTLSWTRNANADRYMYKLLSMSATAEDIAAAESDLSDWTTLGAGENSYTFSKATDNGKLLLLKAIGNGNNIADSPATVCGMRAIYLTVDDSHRLDGYITWQKSGILKKQEVVNQEYGDYEVIRVSECRPGKTMTVNLRCSAGYDETDNVWYFGDTFNGEFKEDILCENIHIVVAIKLAVPSVEMRENCVYLGAVQYADAYKIQVNGGAVTVDANRTPAFESVTGDYVLTIRACNTVDPVQYPDSDPVEFTYSVKTVAVGAITDDTGVARFSATGLLYVKEGEGEFAALEPGAASYAPDATTYVTIEARPGTDLASKNVYIGEAQSTEPTLIVVPIQLDTPVLSEGVDQITIRQVENATGYMVKVDNGEWVSQSGRTVAYPTAVGEHTVYVKAVATDAKQYPASEAAQVTFTTQAVTLTNWSLSGATFSWNAEAYDVKVSIKNTSNFTSVGSNSYTVTEEGTIRVYVRAYAGFVSSSRIYYACDGSYLQESGTVTVSKLSKPSLSVSGTNITWSAVSGANGYEVRVGNGSYVTQTNTSKALSNQEGRYKVYVRAKGNGSTVLTSDAATFEYMTKNVTLSDISVVGPTASWTADAYKTSVKLNGGSYTQTTQTSYTVTEEGTHTFKVKAEGGWEASSNTYYYASSAIEKSATISVLKLSAPVLTTNNKGVTWAAVANATTYAVKVDGGSFKTQTDRNVTFSATTGTHTVYVKAVGSSSGAYQDSNAATFTYETKQTALTFLTTASTMTTWIAEGLKVQYSTDGTNFTDALYSGYTATQNGQVSFRAVGGYDASAKTFYNGNSAVQKKSFTLPGLCIGNNFEGGTSGWAKEVFNGNTNAWDTTTATEVKSVADAYGAGSAIKFKSYLNSMAYRFGYHFGNLPATYKSLSFDVKISDNSAASTSIRFQDIDGGGTYVDYNLSHLSLTPGVWYHATIYFEDDNLVINMGGTEYKPSQAINSPLVGRTKFYEKIKALDHMYITVKGNTSAGSQTFTYIDNFQFSTNAASTSATRITGKEYGFHDGTVGNNYTASGWKAYKYGAGGFEENPNVLKIESGAKALSLYCGGTTSKVTYNVGGSALGTFNHFAIDVGTEAASVSYSIELITESGSSIYVAGGAEFRATLANTSGASDMNTIVCNFASVKIKSIVITASESSGNGHFYIDNIVFTNLS